MRSSDFAAHLIERLAQAGVEEFCLCAGARNASFVKVLGRSEGLRVHSFFEERSAGFFAIGRMKVTGRPVAVITTSGTAVAELLPAVIESHYSSLPLVCVTADRPRLYRGSGAPQAIEQVDIFGGYVSQSLDIEVGEEPSEIRLEKRPLHINLCFDEWNGGEEISSRRFQVKRPEFASVDVQAERVRMAQSFFKKIRKPLMILGEMNASERKRLLPWLQRQKAPILAEPLSGLREEESLVSRLFSGERMATRRMWPDGAFDGVLRFGAVPSFRLWRDLEGKLRELPVLSVSDRPFTGLARAADSRVSWSEWEQANAPDWTVEDLSRWLVEDRLKAEVLESLFLDFPFAETSQVHFLSKQIPNGARVFLGNSLPIREWSLCASRQNRNCEFFANRGANGIDGLISTASGLLEPGQQVWAVLGDLSALYDMVGAWTLRKQQSAELKIVVLNNGGGKIFRPMFHDPLFENNHDLRLKGWAEMFSLGYQELNDIREYPSRPGHEVIEIVPDEGSTERFWKSFEALW